MTSTLTSIIGGLLLQQVVDWAFEGCGFPASTAVSDVMNGIFPFFIHVYARSAEDTAFLSDTVDSTKRCMLYLWRIFQVILFRSSTGRLPPKPRASLQRAGNEIACSEAAPNSDLSVAPTVIHNNAVALLHRSCRNLAGSDIDGPELASTES